MNFAQHLKQFYFMQTINEVTVNIIIIAILHIVAIVTLLRAPRKEDEFKG